MGKSDSSAQTDPCVLLLSPADNILVARGQIDAGKTFLVDGQALTTGASVSLGHKIARTSIRAGEVIRKYGFPIGLATVQIDRGQHVHVHNIKSDYTATYALDKTSAGATEE